MARRARETRLPAPWLRGVRLEPGKVGEGWPFDLPWLTPDFELAFEQPVTVLIGENGSGKSTLLEAIATLCGFGTGGGGAWGAGEARGSAALGAALRGSWLPKVGAGWFLRAGSFERIAGMVTGGYDALSHGEGFATLIAERMQGRGVFLMDEPEAALSPRRQAELLAFLADIQAEASAQVILATHSPMLMAVPGAALVRLTHRGLGPVDLRETDHFRIWQAFAEDPEGFVRAARAGELDTLV